MVIRGGTVVDGTGAPGYAADVRLEGPIITQIGRTIRPGTDDDVLDATGAVVAPGFVDVHTHLDPSLFWDPSADPLPQHGVTSVVTGNCSLSLVPMRDGDREGLLQLFSYIEDLPPEALRDAIPWSWGGWPEYRSAHAAGRAVNVAGLIGHTALRVFVMGEDAWERPATDQERAGIAAALEDLLAAGAFGLSTSLYDEDAGSRPVPSRLADDAELRALIAVLERHRGLLQFVPAYLSDPVASVERVGVLAEGHDVAITWTGLVDDPAISGMMIGMLDRTAARAARGQRFVAQLSPRSVDARISWERSMVFMALRQSWHRVIGAPTAEQRAMLAEPSWRAVARDEWDTTEIVKFPTRRLHKARLVSAGNPEMAAWVGRTLADLVESRGGHPSDVLADWLLDNDMEAGVVLIGLHNDDPAGVASLLKHPDVLVGGSDAGAHVAMVCSAGDTTLLLSRHVRDRGDLSLEDAVAHLTGRAADLVGLRGRGTLVAGAPADITVFGLDELEWLPDHLVADIPGGGSRFRRDASGYLVTIVNGVVTQRNGELTRSLPGRLLDSSVD
jgi:N-acyl-D-aspartate/D-glutamate deacylase